MGSFGGNAMHKKNLSESDICDKFIRPAMEQAGWNGMDQIYREYPLRSGRVVVRGKQAQRDKRAPLKTHDFRADDASNRDQVLRCLFFRQDRRVLGVFHPFFPRSSRIRRFQACLAL